MTTQVKRVVDKPGTSGPMSHKINLSALGVPHSEQLEVPDLETYPHKFSPQAYDQWVEALTILDGSEVPQDAWDKVVKNFLDLCASSKVFAWTQQEIVNDEIMSELIDQRRNIVKFLNKHEIVQQFNTRKTTRTVKMTPTGFILCAEGWSDVLTEVPKILDPQDLEARMSVHRVPTTKGSLWNRQINRGLTFLVGNDGAMMSNRWFYGYEIQIHKFPQIPGNPAAQTMELEKWTLEYLWMPILRAYRPFGLQHRLV